MQTDELFKGIAVIIDDQVNDKEANINKILEQIKQKDIPYLAYETIPSDGIISNFKNISFILLDWNLTTDSDTSEIIQEGVRIPEELQKSRIDDNIIFIKKLKDICYSPIFIFSNMEINFILSKLEESGLQKKDKPDHIFVKSKNDLTKGTVLFKEIDKWVKKNPSIYVLKEWENEYQKSKNKMFVELQELSPVWPKIMWKTYKNDGANTSLELGELITRNLHSRMKPFKFSDEILTKRGIKISKDEIIKVLEGERFLANNNLHADNLEPGDVFKIASHYYVNIRPSCDLIPDRNKEGDNLDDVQLYLLKGCVLSNRHTKKSFLKKYGHFNDHDNQIIIFPMVNGKSIDFRFKHLEIKKWAEVKENRIGRILPPYITRIQQRYAQYIQRQGLSRIPTEAVSYVENVPG